MPYIKREKVEVTRLVCTHPKVKKIWEWGGGSMNPTDGTMHHYISLQLDNDEVVQFDGTEKNNPEEKAEKYLETL